MPSIRRSVLWIFAVVFLLAGRIDASCPDAFEPNESTSGTLWSILDAPSVSYLCSAQDVDSWKIEVSGGQILEVILSDLPKDYRLRLLDPSGRSVAISDAPGTTTERIRRAIPNAAGTQIWFAEVSGKGAFDDADPYLIHARVDLCPDDPAPALESNDESARASRIPFDQLGLGLNLRLCPSGDQDWFVRRMLAGETLSVELHGAVQTPGLVVRACVSDDSMKLLRCTPGRTAQEKIDLPISVDGDYYVSVDGSGAWPVQGVAYQLGVSRVLPASAPAPPQPTPQPASPCPAMSFEPNDSRSAASVLPSGGASSHVCTDKDVDWWSFSAAQDETIQVELKHPSQTYEIALYDPTGAKRAARKTVPGVGHVFLAQKAHASGSWTVEIKPGKRGKADAQNAYRLNVETDSCADVFEPNQHLIDAAPITPGRTSGFLCTVGDRDFYRMSIRSGQLITVDLFARSGLDAFLRLYDPWGGPIASHDRFIAHPALHDGNYVVEVSSRSGKQFNSVNGYRFEFLVDAPQTGRPQADLEILDVEVVQIVQDLTAPIPLAAGRATWARVYVRGDLRPSIGNVRGYLRAERQGAVLQPQIAHCEAPIHAFPAPRTGSILRKTLSHALLCRVPDAWVKQGGTLDLSASIYSPSIRETDAADNRRVSRVEVLPPADLIVQAVQVRDGCEASKCEDSHGPKASDYTTIHHLMRRIFPVRDVRLVPHDESVVWDDEVPTLNALDARYNRRFKNRFKNPRNTFVMGAVRDTLFVAHGRGRGFRPGHAFWVEVGSGDRQLGLAAHELGHNLGLRHVGCAFPVPPPPLNNYRGAPHIDDGEARGGYGFDVDAVPPKVLFPDSRLDVMTYCRPYWISHDHLRLTAQSVQPNVNRNFPASTSPGFAPAGFGLDDDARYLTITGSVGETSGEVRLLPLREFYGHEIAEEYLVNPEGDLLFRLLDASEAPIFEIAFGLPESIPEDGPEGESDLRPLSLLIPDLDDWQSFTILRQDAEIYRATRSEHAPAVSLEEMLVDEARDRIEFSWSADDADDDPLTAVIELSTDGGETWRDVANGVFSRRYELDTSSWAGSGDARLRLTVSDGLRASRIVGESLEIRPKAPLVNLVAPAQDQVLRGGALIDLIADAWDPEDGLIDDEAFSWRSDVQGDLGEGRRLSVRLVPGLHRLEVATSDRDDLAASASVEVLVEPEPDRSGELAELSATLDAPFCIVAGGEFQAAVRLGNYGAQFAADVSLGLYFSVDERFDVDDPLIVGGREFSEPLEPGEETEIEFASLVAPALDDEAAEVGATSAFLGLVIDESASVEENDESDNLITVPVVLVEDAAVCED